MSKQIKILMVAAECAPLAKVGGLADVIGALPKALINEGLDVRIIIPKYGIIDEKKYPLKLLATNLSLTFEQKPVTFNLYQTTLPATNLLVYLIDQPDYLGQNGVYFSADASASGSAGEAKRFTFFSRAVLEIFDKINWTPDVLHCHDWHVSILIPLVKLLNKQLPTLLTVHNLAYQGNYDADLVLNLLNSPEIDLTSLPTIKQRLDNFDTINYLEQGILLADLINTVSYHYAKEILTPEFGGGLEKILKKREAHLYGILNGLDTDRFNPATDPDINYHYSLETIEQKIKNKIALQQFCQLAMEQRLPVIGVVSRLTEQKGFDILLPVIKKILKLPLQFVLLGTGDKNYENQFLKLAKKKKNFYAKIGFDAKLAQLIYAGSDLFLMPSRFEPCGLGQLIAMRYGTLPLVRNTGGLKDTVIDFEQVEGTGFVFQKYEAKELLSTINRAINSYQTDEAKWLATQQRGMAKNFSWDSSAKKYLSLYRKLLNLNQGFIQ